MTSSSKIISEDLERIISSPISWERLKNKVVLITGANGFLPAYMVETLLFLNTKLALNCKVIGLVRNLEKARARFREYANRADLVFVQGDVSEPQQWPERCDFIIHAASQASPVFYGRDPVGTMDANILGTSHLLKMAREWKSEEFLYFSSGEVYGEVAADKIPTRETDYGYIDINNPRSCYAESKRASETLGMSYAAQFGTPFKVVRPFHTYGPGMALDDGRVFADFVNDVVHSRDVTLKSEGLAVRAFCYLSDAVTGFFTVMLNGAQATAYNVGNPDGAISIRDLAEVLVSLFPEKKLKVIKALSTHSSGYLPSPISINSPNVDRLKSLGWSPFFSVSEGFRRTILHYQK
jgi:UDP-glucuronate decarboxylase